MEESVKRVSLKLEKIGIKGVYKAFKDLRPRAFRSDLWRWLILWENGGVYLDAKMFFSKDVNWIDWDQDQFLVCAEFFRSF